MPYIDTKEIAAKRKAIKAEFPKFKFSIKRDHYSTIRVTVLEGPLPFPALTPAEEKRGSISVNPYQVNSHFAEFPAWSKVLNRVIEIARAGVKVLVEDGDYGTVPTFYYDVNIGEWNRPYVKK